MLKKIISLTYLIIFLFGLLIPFEQSKAQNETNKLSISADKYSISSTEDIFITAKTYAFANKLITFKSTPTTGVTFTPSTCTTGSADFKTQIASCQVGFKATTEGTYKITASMAFNGTTTSNEISIMVTKNGGVITNCPKPGYIMLNGVCVDPISYCPIGQILVGNSCITCTKPLVANATNDACIAPATVTPATPAVTDTTYTPQEKLPGIPDVIETDSNKSACPFGNYLNTIIKIVIGFAAVLAFIMIVMGGVEYMTTELISSKEAGKDTIKNALLGLIIALGSYLILNTINPQLLNACLNTLPEAKITIGSAKEYRLSQTQATDTKFRRTTYYDQIKTISLKYNMPNCLLQVAIQRESGGVPNLVGHDENVPSSGVPSRKTFVNSGKKYNGEAFTINSNLITTNNFLNNDNASGSIFSASNPSASDLGLDWRFSHSVGLFGVTYFPGNNANAKDTLNSPDKDITLAATIMSNFYKQCGGNVEQTYRAYGSGGCTNNGSFIGKEAPLRKSLYDQCLAQDK